jgi:C-terminal processing protease CtpA/Prc
LGESIDRQFKKNFLIAKVFQGSPASVDLQRGDIILRVQQRDVKQMHHYEAVELIENAGGSLQLTVNRYTFKICEFSKHYLMGALRL